MASFGAENHSFSRPLEGEGPGGENFPFPARLIPARSRPQVLAFYRFARLARSITDAPGLSAEQKTAWLEALDAALDGEDVSSAPVDGPENAPEDLLLPARALCVSLAASGVTVLHPRHMLQAFRQDVVKHRYLDWSELLAYCRFSAAPVGRFVLDLYGEERSAWPAAEALCAAVQILGQLRDCKQNYARLDRVYLPLRWFESAGITPDSLGRQATSPELRGILDRALEGVLRLIRAARPLPRQIKNRGLRLRAAVILATAEMLAAKLGKHDPLVRRLALSKPERLWAASRGLARGLTG